MREGLEPPQRWLQGSRGSLPALFSRSQGTFPWIAFPWMSSARIRGNLGAADPPPTPQKRLGGTTQFLGISGKSRLETEPAGMGDFGAVPGTLRGFGLFWGRGEGTMEVSGCPRRPQIKARGNFPGFNPCVSHGNGAAGSPLSLPRLGRFYWNQAKENQDFFCLFWQKKGGGIPLREAATALSPQIFHGRGVQM